MKLGRPASVTLILSVLFAFVSFSLFASIATYLHFALRGQLLQSDAEELHGKLALIRDLVAKRSNDASLAEDAWRIRDILTGHDRMRLVVRRPDGEVLLAYPRELLPGTERIPADAQAPAMLFDASGTLYQALAGEVLPPGAARPLRLELAMNEQVHTALLASYRGRLVVAVLVGTLFAALLGWGAARYGMRPIRRLANAAARISAERLGERIDPAAAPRELQELVSAFNGMLERLELSFRKLEDFSSDLAHELRTPINNLMLETEVALERARSPEEYSRVLGSIREECERLSRTVSDMLFLAKADADQLLVGAETVSLRSECEKVVAFFQALLDENGVEVSVEGEADARGDPLLVRRAITNLLSNAVRYTPRGQRIAIALSAGPDGEARLEMRNPGPGIAPEHLGRVFDRFFRGDPSRERSQEGSGLGLAIVAAIMGLHRGETTVRSSPGSSTAFTLRFPPACPPRTRREQE